MAPFLLDLRALALLRMALGLLMLADLAIRFPDISVFYVADGVCPIECMPSPHWTMMHFQLYRLTPDWLGVAGLFFLTAVAATSLVLGFRCRLSAALSWYLLCSLQSRNIYLNDAGDLLLRIVLFCCIFLPIGARWSLDANRHPEWKKLPDRFSSWATVAYVIQVCAMYLTASILKSDASWRVTGDALYLALSVDQFTTGFAHWLLHYPTVLRVLNFLALSLEFCAPLLLLCPFFTPVCRTLALGCLLLFHLGIASCLHLGLMMPICIAVLLGLLPTELLDRVLGAKEQVAPPQALPPAYRLGRIEKGLMATYIAFVVVQNAATVPESGLLPRVGDNGLQVILGYGRATAVMQNWTLFAPEPLRQDGWFVVEGLRADGSSVDLLTGKSPASYAKPELVSAQFKNQRWRRHFQCLWMRYSPQHVPLYLRWEGQRWNREHPDQKVVSLRLIFVQEYTQLPGIPQKSEVFSLGEYPSRWLPGTLEKNVTE